MEKKIKFKKLPETIRINLEAAGHPGFSALVIPKEETAQYFREFYLIDDNTGAALYMFGAEVQDDNLAAEVAVLGASEYRDLLEDRE